MRVRTPSGGLHVWYRTGPHQSFASSTGSGNGKAALAWQVDVRSQGGYIVAPGTVTAAGDYLPVGTVREPAPLPAWIAAELTRTGHLVSEHAPAQGRVGYVVPQRGRQAVAAVGGGRGTAAKALSTLLTDVMDCAQVLEGAGFNDKLNRAAFTAGGLVASGHLTHTEAEELLREAAETARPGQERRSLATIRSGLAAGAARPLHPGGGRG